MFSTHSFATDRVFERMAADRQEQSAEKRGEGERSKRTITAEADKEVEILLANARRDSEIIRGEGDQKRNARQVSDRDLHIGGAVAVFIGMCVFMIGTKLILQ